MSSGVYVIRNLVNGRMYIGSSIDVHSRIVDSHFPTLMAGIHHNPSLQNAWNKYGSRSFSFEVICYCPPESRLAIEQEYLDRFWSLLYNLNPTAGSSLGRSRSYESRRKMSESRRSSWKNPSYRSKLEGRKRSEESRERMRQAHLGKKRGPMSKDHREKIRQSKINYHQQQRKEK